jgi:hypothetical protein
MMEKYDVVDTTRQAGGGEYPTQDGFGWTNGVALALFAQQPQRLREDSTIQSSERPATAAISAMRWSAAQPVRRAMPDAPPAVLPAALPVSAPYSTSPCTVVHTRAIMPASRLMSCAATSNVATRNSPRQHRRPIEIEIEIEIEAVQTRCIARH